MEMCTTFRHFKLEIGGITGGQLLSLLCFPSTIQLSNYAILAHRMEAV